MSRPQSCLAEQTDHEAKRWMPPDVSLSLRQAAPVIPQPTAAEITAIEDAARAAGSAAGYQAGYQEGYQEGLVQALKQADEERQGRRARELELRSIQEATLKETVAALEGIAVDLADPLARTADDLEPELLMLVVTLARRVIMEELCVRPDLITRVLQQALAQLPSRNHALRIHVHPDDQAILDTYANALGERITWFGDPAIERGGCLVESGPSRIDASLEARLRQSIDAVWGSLVPPVTSDHVLSPEERLEDDPLEEHAPEEEPLENDA